MFEDLLVHWIVDLIRCRRRIIRVWMWIGEKLSMRIWQPNSIVDPIANSKYHTVNRQLSVGPRTTCRGGAVASHQDIFLDLEATHPSVRIGQHTGRRR